MSDSMCVELKENREALQMTGENLNALKESTETLNLKLNNLELELKEDRQKLEGKIEALEVKLEENKEALEAKMQDNKEALEAKFEENKARIEKNELEINKKISEIEKRFLQVDNVSVINETNFPETPVVNYANVKSFTKPPTFDGQSSWTAFKTQFEIIGRANRWDNLTKASYLAASLRSGASEVLQIIPEEKRLDYESLVSALELRYGETHLKQFHGVQLKNRQQRPGESLQELAADIERVARLAYAGCPTDVQDHLAQQHFVDAISDPDVQQSTRMADCASLRAALVHAMKFESARRASRGSRRTVRSVSFSDEKSENGMTDIVRSLREICADMKKSIAGNQRIQSNDRYRNSREGQERKKLKCWRCGNEGHIQLNCHLKPKPRDVSATVAGAGNDQ